MNRSMNPLQFYLNKKIFETLTTDDNIFINNCLLHLRHLPDTIIQSDSNLSHLYS